MKPGRLEFTALFLKSNQGYTGFIAELPGISAHGRTIEEAREALRQMTLVIFDEERRGAEEMLRGKSVVRESFVVQESAQPR